MNKKELEQNEQALQKYLGRKVKLNRLAHPARTEEFTVIGWKSECYGKIKDIGSSPTNEDEFECSLKAIVIFNEQEVLLGANTVIDAINNNQT